MALFRVRDGFLSMRDWRREFSRTISDVLCTFKRFHNFICECEMGISRTWCQSGETYIPVL